MSAKVKYTVINRHRNEHSISVMCKFFKVSRSGYYDYVKRMGQPEHDLGLVERIKAEQGRQNLRLQTGLQVVK